MQEEVDVRRLARRRALGTREAARLVNCALHVARTAKSVHCDELSKLQSALMKEAMDLDVKAFGRIEPRQQKGTGHPLLETRVPSFMFIDESGSTCARSGIDTFAVGAVVLTQEATDLYCVLANQLKSRFFGDRLVTLHEPMMRKHDGQFRFDGDADRQLEFDDALFELLKEVPFKAFGVGIRTTAYKEEFLDAGIDPYLPENAYSLAIHLLLERYVDYLANEGEHRRLGIVAFESIGPKEDAVRQHAYVDLLRFGTQFVSDRAFCSWLRTGCDFSPKSGTSAAELADIVAREVFEWTRSSCAVAPKYWDLLSERWYGRSDGRHGKFGLKIFPDADIRDRIDAHRQACLTPEN